MKRVGGAICALALVMALGTSVLADSFVNVAQSTDWARQPGVVATASYNGSAAPLDTGTISSFSLGGWNTFNIAGKTWADNQWYNHVLKFTSGALAGKTVNLTQDAASHADSLVIYDLASNYAGVAAGDTIEIWSPAQGLVDPRGRNAGWFGNTASSRDWVMVDLGQERTIGGVSQQTFDLWSRAPASFKFQVGGAAADPNAADDDPAWTTVVNVPAWNVNTNTFAYSFAPVQGQKVRYLYDHPGNPFPMMGTFSVFSGAAVSMSRPGYWGNSFIGSGYTSWPQAFCAIDGDLMTFAAPNTGDNDQSYIIDVGADKEIMQVVLKAAVFGANPAWGNLQDISLQYSLNPNADLNNPADWTEAAYFAGTPGGSLLDLAIDLPGIKAAKWRIYHETASPLALAEIQFNVVPEPGSFVALAAGLLGTAGLFIRRKTS